MIVVKTYSDLKLRKNIDIISIIACIIQLEKVFQLGVFQLEVMDCSKDNKFEIEKVSTIIKKITNCFSFQKYAVKLDQFCAF